MEVIVDVMIMTCLVNSRYNNSFCKLWRDDKNSKIFKAVFYFGCGRFYFVFNSVFVHLAFFHRFSLSFGRAFREFPFLNS